MILAKHAQHLIKLMQIGSCSVACMPCYMLLVTQLDSRIMGMRTLIKAMEDIMAGVNGEYWAGGRGVALCCDLVGEGARTCAF